jgi:hypothetical protein
MFTILTDPLCNSKHYWLLFTLQIFEICIFWQSLYKNKHCFKVPYLLEYLKKAGNTALNIFLNG